MQTQIQFVFDRLFRRQALGQFLELRTSRVGLLFVKHPRARRYVLRLGRDGLARVTIPRGGSAAQAKAFAERNIPWLEDQLSKTAALIAPKPWVGGVEILFRGNAVKLHEEDHNSGRLICFAGERVRLRQGVSDARPLVERHLWKLAARELPPLVLSMAATHGLPVRRVSVRNQRSRWGSCSRNGTISLNWRLVQTPEFVRDYIVLHELAHLKEMNHSRKFWNEVAGLCPEFRQAENWLKQNAALLG